MSFPAAFMAKVEVAPDGCWLWLGAQRGKGYGAFYWEGVTHRAHRFAYAWVNGEPAGEVHHTCRNRLCVNPDHLQDAVAGQPRHRGPRLTHCAHGHEFTPENTYRNPRGERQCRTCLRDASNRHRAANREAINAKKRAARERVTYEPRECEASDCRNIFTPIRSTGDYCSSACYQRERHRRRKAL